jgi:hypothetical protein
MNPRFSWTSAPAAIPGSDDPFNVDRHRNPSPAPRQSIVRRGAHAFRLLSFIIGCASVAGGAAAQSFSDTFEAAALDPGWVIAQQQSGTVSLSTDQNNTLGGSQSLKLASTSGDQRYVKLRRYLGAPMKGTVAVDFYDAAPGQETLYVNFDLSNTESRMHATLGTQDFDAYCYKGFITVADAGVIFGPNANCGIYPQLSTTNVQRTPGWHRFSITIGSQDVVLSIDSTPVYTFPGDFSFDRIELDLSGPVWRPNTVAYFDNFSFVPAAECDIDLGRRVYTNGQTVTVTGFRLANNSSTPLETEIKSWLSIPGFAPITIINTGADGSVTLPVGFDTDLGPFGLFQVAAAFPRGAYQFSCRILDPKTGATLASSLNPFLLETGCDQSFFDGFDRPDGSVGNGWATFGAGASIAGGKLQTTGQVVFGGGIYRTLSVGFPLTFSFEFSTANPLDGGWFLAVNAVSTLVPGPPAGQISFQQYRGSRNVIRRTPSGFEQSPGLPEPIPGWQDYGASAAHVQGLVNADLSSVITITYADGDRVTASFGPTASGPIGPSFVLGNSNASAGPHYFDNLRIGCQ